MTQKIVINIVLTKLVLDWLADSNINFFYYREQLNPIKLRSLKNVMKWVNALPCQQLIEDLNKSQIYYQRDYILSMR